MPDGKAITATPTNADSIVNNLPISKNYSLAFCVTLFFLVKKRKLLYHKK
jgi:hypothetical protein